MIMFKIIKLGLYCLIFFSVFKLFFVNIIVNFIFVRIWEYSVLIIELLFVINILLLNIIIEYNYGFKFINICIFELFLK